MKPLALAIKKRTFRQLWLWWILPFILIAGWRYPILGYFIPFCMLAGVGIALVRERYSYDCLCPQKALPLQMD